MPSNGFRRFVNRSRRRKRVRRSERTASVSIRRVQMTRLCESDSTIRQDLVNRVRAEIAAGTYDTPEKMEAALEMMFQRIGMD